MRTRLPFAVSTFAGQVPVGGTRAVVYEFVYGAKLPLASFSVEYAASVGEAIAAIHALPTSFVVGIWNWPIEKFARRLERLLVMAQVTIPTSRLLLILLLAPIEVLT